MSASHRGSSWCCICASKRKAEDLSTLMSVSSFASWSPLKKFMVISTKGSAKVADRSHFKIHRELKSILATRQSRSTNLLVVTSWSS
ncbi:hypothetical protein PoB_005155100 [Plakobranchus ocellatus]|uniref:Uncharacterized protein n=1 Tax=Plakobranchus ocellatus TaxID=259542 RepID=A0AAV4BP68_9GAST|nr:hypothetical protein PoB_005155100 [Plakobranchus ocellatus]